MRKIFLFIILCCVLHVYGQDMIKFPYTYGTNTYLMGDRGQAYFDECKDNTFKYIEVQPEGYGSGDYQQIIAGCSNTKKWIDKAGLKVWSIHLPYGNSYDVSTTDEEKRQRIVDELTVYIRALAEVYKPYAMVLHPSGEPITTGKDRSEHITQSAKSVSELAQVADEVGVVLCVENLPRTCLGSTPDEMLQIVSPTKNARICFDTNHYLKGTHYEFLRKVGHLVATVHISDYDYNDEKHVLPGLGKLPWGDLLFTLEEFGYNGVLMSESDKDENGYTNPTETRKAFDRIVAEYEKVKADPVERGRMFLNDMKTFYWKGQNPEEFFTIGDDPGYYPQDKVDLFLSVYNDALNAVDNHSMTLEEFMQYRDKLTDQCPALIKSANKLTEGYYRIISAHEGFTTNGKKMAMYSDEDKILKWKTLEPSTNFLFKISDNINGTYSIQNVANSYYVFTQSEYSTPVPMSDTHQVDQCVEFLGKGMAKIFNVENSIAYHTEGHSDGAGNSGNIVIWNSSPIEGSGSSWILEKVDFDFSNIIEIPQSGYTTFFSDRAIVVPDHVNAGVVTDVDVANKTVIIDWIYTASDVIPANTGVVLRGKAGSYIYEYSENAGISPSVNLLKGSTSSGMTIGTDVFFYKLSEGDKGVEFSWGNNDGSAFENKANRAYLTVPYKDANNLSSFYFYNNAGLFPRFAVMSDIHVGAEDWNSKIPTAWKNLVENKPALDAIFICGDLTDYGLSTQYDDLSDLLNDKTLLPANLPIYILMGNHDNYGDPDGTSYLKLGQPLHQFIDIKGYPFITISTRGTANSGISNHDDEAYNFLSEKLAFANENYPGKPIFVFTHIPPENTVYGSDSWGNSKLYEIMSKYPQVVAFSGHTHFPIGDPRSISQVTFTAINDGSTTYSELAEGEVSDGLWPTGYDLVTEAAVVNLDENHNVIVERWNTADNEEILPKWEINAPHDGTNFKYKDWKGGDSPEFSADADIQVREDIESCLVTFKQAKDDEVVQKYRVEIVDQKETISKYEIFSGFFLNSKMPESLSVSFDGLPAGKELYARITAIDSYGNESVPLVSSKFEVKRYEPAEGSSAPEVDLLDVFFEDGKQVSDLSPLKNTISVSEESPNIYYEKLYQGYGAEFTGSSYCYYKIDYSNNEKIKNALCNSFSLELLYKPKDVSSTCDPFCSTENGGVGLEQSGSDISFWCHVGGSYEKITCQDVLKENVWYHIVATYDKTSGKMCMFINGRPMGTLEVSGDLALSSSKEAQWFGVGGDACPSDYVQYPFEGNILVARIYGKAVDRDEVYWMNDKVTDFIMAANSEKVKEEAQKIIDNYFPAYVGSYSSASIAALQDALNAPDATDASIQEAIDQIKASSRKTIQADKYYRIQNTMAFDDGQVKFIYESTDGINIAWGSGVENVAELWKLDAAENGTYYITSANTGKQIQLNPGAHDGHGYLVEHSTTPFTLENVKNNYTYGLVAYSQDDRATLVLQSDDSWGSTATSSDLSGNFTGTYNDFSVNIPSKWNIVETESIRFEISAAGYATAWFPFTVNIPSGVEVYYVNAVNTEKAFLKPVEGIIPAKSAVIVKGEPGTYVFEIANDQTEPIEGNYLIGLPIATNIDNAVNAYILGNKEGVSGFYQLNTEDRTIAANKAYLQLPETAADIKVLEFDFGATGIDGTEADLENEIYYDLQGRRIEKPSKGIYVTKNGKKVIFD